MLRGAFLSVGVLASVVQGVDLDYKAAKLKSDQQRAVADQALSVYQADEAEFQTANARHLAEMQQEATLQTKVSDLEQALRTTNSQISTLELTIPHLVEALRNVEGDLQKEQDRLPRLRAADQREEHQLRRAEERLRRAEENLKKEKDKTPPVEADIARAKEEKKEADDKLDEAKKENKKAERELRQCENRIRELENGAPAQRQELANKRAELAQANRSRQDTTNDLQNARDDLRQQKDAVSTANSQKEDARRQAVASKTQYDRQELEAGQLYDYYVTVVGNYNSARQSVIDTASASGSSHGAREAGERAPGDGTQTGTDTAIRVGSEAGAREAKTRQYVAGYRSARATPTQDDSSYQLGIADGKAKAIAKAVAEDFAKGYNAQMAVTMASEPASVEEVKMDEVLSSSPPATEEGGQWLSTLQRTVKTVAPPGFSLPADPAYALPKIPAVTISVPASDRRYSKPACGTVVLPEFGPLCQNSYASSYSAGYDSSYRSVFSRNYQDSFNQGIKNAYETARVASAPTEYNKGLANGARDQGVLDGFAAQLPIAQAEQSKLGADAWNAYLSTGHLLRVQSVRLEESSGDALFTPGEKVSMTIVMDNLGGKPAPAATLSASLRQSLRLSGSDASRALGRLEKNTRTTIHGAVFGTLLAGPAGSEASMSASLSRGPAFSSETRLDAKAILHFPLELQSMQLAKNPKVNEEVEAKLRFKNLLTTKIDSTDLKVFSAPVVASVSGDSLKAVQVDAGQEVELAAKIKPGVWVGGNTQVPFFVETSHLGGVTGVISQPFSKKVEIDRAASLLLYGWDGKEIPNSTIDVAAGGVLRFQAQFKFHRTAPVAGPFTFVVSTTSDPGVRPIAGTITRSDYGSAGPSSRFPPIALQYTVPASLKGKKAHVLVGLLEGGNYIHVLQVNANVL